jgi:hypothetical protein
MVIIMAKTMMNRGNPVGGTLVLENFVFNCAEGATLTPSFIKVVGLSIFPHLPPS